MSETATAQAWLVEGLIPRPQRRATRPRIDASSIRSPLFRRATRTSSGPAPMCQRSPAGPRASRDRVLDARPCATAARIAGQASSVDAKRPSVRPDGINRSSYSTAPSMQISVVSPGLRTNGLGRHSTRERSSSGISRSGSSICAGIAFALRGAPCGNDPGNESRNRDYHDEDAASLGPAHDSHPILRRGVLGVRGPHRHRASCDSLGFQEGDAVPTDIDRRLPRIPTVTGHCRTIATVRYLALIRC